MTAITATERSPSAWSLRSHWPLLVAALLISSVWLLPILLGYYGIVDPGLTYRASPAQASSTPWEKLNAADAATVASFARILGVAVILVGVVGLTITWWPLVRGRAFAIVSALSASLAVLLIGAYFHRAGYWNVWPLYLVMVLWGAGALAAGIWLARERTRFGTRDSRRTRHRPS